MFALSGDIRGTYVTQGEDRKGFGSIAERDAKVLLVFSHGHGKALAPFEVRLPIIGLKLCFY